MYPGAQPLHVTWPSLSTKHSRAPLKAYQNLQSEQPRWKQRELLRAWTWRTIKRRPLRSVAVITLLALLAMDAFSEVLASLKRQKVSHLEISGACAHGIPSNVSWRRILAGCDYGNDTVEAMFLDGSQTECPLSRHPRIPACNVRTCRLRCCLGSSEKKQKRYLTCNSRQGVCNIETKAKGAQGIPNICRSPDHIRRHARDNCIVRTVPTKRQNHFERNRVRSPEKFI